METAYSNRAVGFTKLFASMIHSTVWRAEMPIKVVWVTMLAMADRNGRVWASVPGLADAAKVSLDECVEALEFLSSPDVWSRTKTAEGRRIKEIEGGWELLNYLKYREMRDEDERRIQTREAVRRHREKKAAVSHGKPRKPLKAQAEAEAEAEAEKEQIPALENALTARFARFWAVYPNKKGKGAARKAWEKRHPSETLTDLIVAAVQRQCSWPEWVKDGGQFIPHPATWLNRESWDDESYAETMVAFEQPTPRAKSSLEIINEARAAAGRPLLKG